MSGEKAEVRAVYPEGYRDAQLLVLDRAKAIEIAANRIPPDKWRYDLIREAERIRNYIMNGDVQEEIAERVQEAKRCPFCGMSIDIHEIVTEQITPFGGNGPKRLQPVGYRCPNRDQAKQG